MKLLILILLPFTILAQTWTEPVNISPNLPGLDNQPDLCIDKNGTLHCVFTHKLDNNWRKIYYAKSTDDGETWTTPEDISLNEDLSLMKPHIVADTNNNLYVAWDYNTGNPYQTMIYIKKHNGTNWEEPVNITPVEPESHGNKLVIDYNNRLYCFWGKGGYDIKTYYKYMENNIWSETICPYPGNHYWATSNIAVDEYNNLHCIGMYHEEGQSHDEDRVIYFKYEYDNLWSDKTFLSKRTAWLYGNEIDVDNQNLPHVAYRRKDPNSTGPNDDSTMYRHNNGVFWTLPELVVNDPAEQRIIIDPYNRVHIIDREKLETGTKLVHYQKYGGFWQGYIIDTATNSVGMPSLLKSDYFLYLVYTYSAEINTGDISFTKYDIVTGSKPIQKSFINTMCIYPNPFKTQTTIEFTTTKEQHINLSIYNISGKHIKTLMNENTVRGEYQLIWNGKGKHGKVVNGGLYLVRLQSGRKIVTKTVEYIK